MNRITRIALVGLATLLVAAPLVSAAHSVAITSGKADDSSYTMTVKVDKFNLVPFAGKSGAEAHKKGEGHIHYLANGKDACSAGKADCAAPTDYATTATTFTFKNLKDGDKLQAELVLSDHTPSGTDANSNLDGSRVLSSEVNVDEGMGIPAAPAMLVAVAILGLAFILRRR